MRKFTAVATGVLLIGAAHSAGDAYADRIDWDAIASCESGGDWSADTGNGAYGGLGISAEDWRANGGDGLPSQATQQQQIAVANRILANRGPGAWSACAARGVGSDSAPIGSLTHYVTELYDNAERPVAQAD
ncbi:transglycosylase family protein [[Mycobacterium] kokjensenii]|uniref:Transglycosylase family protein n=1 Tax=[Mycobacterium] kokjensenii TaxID=3064287 RepID=A0ABM9LBD4_9MYCO|nr:transglycosylase family protein [Mycolicibacter sp. MU0083]CAJ1496172.1 transglycosylase family protein [Mycolicibacter sp. MU0083]